MMSSFNVNDIMLSKIENKIVFNLLKEADLRYIIKSISDNYICDASNLILELNELYNGNLSDFRDFGFRMLLADKLGHYHICDFDFAYQPVVFEDVIDQLFQWHVWNPHPFKTIVRHQYNLPWSWAEELFGSIHLLEKCETLRDLHELLLTCGDIEENPGPVYSKIQAQIGINVNHKIDISSLFAAMDNELPEIMTQFAKHAGKTIPDAIIEKVKSRTVALSISIYNIARWSYGHLKTADLVVNLISSIVTCTSVSMTRKALSIVFDGIFAQSDNESLVRVALKALCVVFFLITCSKLPGKHTIDEFISRCRNIPQALKSIELLWEMLGPITKQLQLLVEKYGFKYDTSHEESDYIGSVQEFVDDVSEFSSLFKRKQINKDAKTLSDASRLHSRGVKLLHTCVRQGYDRKNAELIRSLLPTSFKISEAALRSGADKCKVRQEPVMVWLTGGSGIGKSTLTYPFLADVMIRAGEDMTDGKWQSLIYARTPETEYCDGYVGQRYWVYDDAFQIRDSIANPSIELFEVIRLGNMFPYMLHMAALEEKNNSFAECDMALLTSNLDRIVVESLHCKEAVARRLTHCYHTQLKEEYRQYYMSNSKRLYKLDKSKAITDAEGDPINMDVYMFQKFDPHSGDLIGEAINYEQFLNIVATDVIKTKENFTQYDDFLKDYVTRRCETQGRPVAQIGEVNNFDGRHHTSYDPRRRERLRHVHEKSKETPGAYYHGSSVEDYFDHECGFMRQGVVHNLTALPGYRPAQGLLENVYCGLRNIPYGMRAAFFVPGFVAQNKGWDVFPDWYIAGMKKYLIDDRSILTNNVLYANDWDYAHYESSEAIVTQADCDFIEKCRRNFVVYKEKFMRMYYEVRFNLPHITAKLIGGLICALGAGLYLYRLCQNVRSTHLAVTNPEQFSWNEAYNKIKKDITRAESCAKRDCTKCKRCANAPTSYLDKFDYWGISCACYVDVCEHASEKHRRLFVAFLNERGVPKINKTENQAQLLNLMESCNCDVCPLCQGSDRCICLKTAIDRGCSIGDLDLLDRNNIYEKITLQNHDGKGKINQERRTHIVVQNHDGKGKPNQDRKPVIRVQNHDGKGKPNQDRRPIIRVQNEDIEEEDDIIAQVKDIGNDVAAVNVMNNRVWPNLLWLYLARKGESKVFRKLGHCVMLRGKIGLINQHFVMAMEYYPDMDVVFKSSQGVIFEVMPVERVIRNAQQIGEKDACLIVLDKKGMQFPDIVKHFISKSQSLSFTSETLSVCRYNIEGDAMYPFPILTSDAQLICQPKQIEFGCKNEVVMLTCPISWEYNASTVNGDCGAPLVLHNSRVPTKICGIHNAYSLISGLAYGVPLYQEEIRKTLAEYPAEVQYGGDIPIGVEADKLVNVMNGDSFLVLGLEKGQYPTPTQTQVKKSPIHGELISTLTKPGYLRPVTINGELIDPASKARAKWGTHTPEIDPLIGERCDEVINSVCQITCKNEPDEYKMPLTYEEAIVGIPGVDYIDSINKITSPGYPYNQNKRKGKGKTGYFGAYEFDLTTEAAKEVQRDVEDIFKCIMRGERPFIVWMDTLKDARIPIEKADAGKTRIFACGPMHYTILYRMCFLPFFAHLTKNRINNFFGPGINPTSPEWHRLAMKMMSKGMHVIAGDYSNWDGKSVTAGFKSVYTAAEKWYARHWDLIVKNKRNVFFGVELDFDQFCTLLRCVAVEVLNHVHTCNIRIEGEMYKIFYQVQNGIPSGCPGTAPTNSGCNLWMLAYCYFWSTRGTTNCSVGKFFEYIYAIFYGDDICVNISPLIIDFFNQETLTPLMKQLFDIDFTDEQKTGTIVKSRTLNQITFLKRSFVFNKEIQLYVAPLPVPLLLDITNWVRSGSESPYVITIDNLRCVLGEIALNSKEIYNMYRPRIEGILQRLTRGLGMPAALDTYFGYVSKVRDGEFSGIEE
nr:MAG: nonstructural polyprotein [Planococcus ficus-associated dicistrovirus 1]